MSSKKKKSKAEKKAEKKIKKYYKEKEETTKKRAEMDAKRIQEDLDRIYAEAGIAKTRAMEDYERNIKNIEDNQAADKDDLNYYLTTTRGRTQEDLDTSLAKETRRYSLEWEKINQGLADSGLTFSDRRPEKIAQETSEIAKQDINREASRSFQDIARYEAAKTRDLELKYGQATEQVETQKNRTLEDILNEQNRATTQAQRGQEDVSFNLDTSLKDISYGKDTDIATTGQMFDQQSSMDKIREEQRKAFGYALS